MYCRITVVIFSISLPLIQKQWGLLTIRFICPHQRNYAGSLTERHIVYAARIHGLLLNDNIFTARSLLSPRANIVSKRLDISSEFFHCYCALLETLYFERCNLNVHKIGNILYISVKIVVSF